MGDGGVSEVLLASWGWVVRGRRPFALRRRVTMVRGIARRVPAGGGRILGVDVAVVQNEGDRRVSGIESDGERGTEETPRSRCVHDIYDRILVEKQKVGSGSRYVLILRQYLFFFNKISEQ